MADGCIPRKHCELVPLVGGYRTSCRESPTWWTIQRSVVSYLSIVISLIRALPKFQVFILTVVHLHYIYEKDLELMDELAIQVRALRSELDRSK